MFCMLKKKKYILLWFQNMSFSFPNSKWGKMQSYVQRKLTTMALSCSKKTISIIKNSFYTSRWLLLTELASFFATTKKIESNKRVCENKDLSIVIMPSEDTKILEFNHYQKSDKASFIIYGDLECIVEKSDWCKNNPENSSTNKVKFFNVYNIFI